MENGMSLRRKSRKWTRVSRGRAVNGREFEEEEQKMQVILRRKSGKLKRL